MGLTRCADLPIRLVRPSRKQNFERFCNFFAIRDSLLSVQSGNGPFRGRFAAFSGLNLLLAYRAVPNRKKVANRVALLFSRPQNSSVGQIAPRYICLHRELVNQRSAENKKGLLKASLCHVKWCPRRDLNPHVFRQRFLRPPRLPFRHSGAGLHYT